jgi:hypothetical protein
VHLDRYSTEFATVGEKLFGLIRESDSPIIERKLDRLIFRPLPRP